MSSDEDLDESSLDRLDGGDIERFLELDERSLILNF